MVKLDLTKPILLEKGSSIMGIRVIGGYYGALRNTVATTQAKSKVAGLTFFYLCNLVYPDNAGPNFGLVSNNQVTDVFDLLRVRYDGQRVVATKTDDHVMAGYELIGGRFEYADGSYDEVDLASLDRFIRHHPTSLIKSPMIVQTVKTRKTGDTIAGETFSGQWQLGDSQGFRQLIPAQSDDLQPEVTKLCQAIDQLAELQPSVDRITGQEYLAKNAVQRANVAAWYDLSRRKVDFVQALSTVRLATLANLKYTRDLKQTVTK